MKKFGPVRGAKMSKEEAWNAATKRSTRGSLSKEDKENSSVLEAKMSEELVKQQHNNRKETRA